MIVTPFCRKPGIDCSQQNSPCSVVSMNFEFIGGYFHVYWTEPHLCFQGIQLKFGGFQYRLKGCLHHLESNRKISHKVEAFFLWKENYHQGIFGVSPAIGISNVINQSISNIRSVSYERFLNENIFENVWGMKGNYTCKSVADM